MNKMELGYLTERVNQVVMCTNGNISTKLNAYLLETGLNDNEKVELISDGKAKLKPINVLVEDLGTCYRSSHVKALIKCFDFPETPFQKQQRLYNKRIEDQESELHNTVELEGRRLIDRVVMGVLPASDAPDELHRLGDMVSLVVSPKPFKEIKIARKAKK